MKRKILFLAFVLSTLVGWSQTVTLKFKNGTTQQYNMSELESIDFKDDNSGRNQETTYSIVGTWVSVYAEGWGQSWSNGELPIWQINADGTYLFLDKEDNGIKVEHGRWTMVDNHFYQHITEGENKGTVLDYSILILTNDTLQMQLLGFTGTFKRVSSDVLNKYSDLIGS